jgi:hypothetical protein
VARMRNGVVGSTGKNAPTKPRAMKINYYGDSARNSHPQLSAALSPQFLTAVECTVTVIATDTAAPFRMQPHRWPLISSVEESQNPRWSVTDAGRAAFVRPL